MEYDYVIGDEADWYPAKLAKYHGASFVPFEVVYFPDNEVKTRIKIRDKSELKGRSPIVVLRDDRLSTNPDRYLMQNIHILRTIARAQPRRLGVVLPHMKYDRQDKEFIEGEPQSLSDVAWMFDNLSKDCESCESLDLFALNTHLYGKEREEGEDFQSFFDFAKAHDISVSRAFGNYLKANFAGVIGKGEDVVVVGPDTGAVKMIKELSKYFKGPDPVCIKQERDPKTGEKRIVNVPPEISKVRGKPVIIFDDVTASGGTLCRAYDVVKRYGPKSIFIAVVHMIGEKAPPRLSRLDVNGILTTDSLRTRYDTSIGDYFNKYNNYIHEVPTIPAIGDYIKKL